VGCALKTHSRAATTIAPTTIATKTKTKTTTTTTYNNKNAQQQQQQTKQQQTTTTTTTINTSLHHRLASIASIHAYFYKKKY